MDVQNRAKLRLTCVETKRIKRHENVPQDILRQDTFCEIPSLVSAAKQLPVLFLCQAKTESVVVSVCHAVS